MGACSHLGMHAYDGPVRTPWHARMQWASAATPCPPVSAPTFFKPRGTSRIPLACWATSKVDRHVWKLANKRWSGTCGWSRWNSEFDRVPKGSESCHIARVMQRAELLGAPPRRLRFSKRLHCLAPEVRLVAEMLVFMYVVPYDIDASMAP